MAEDETAALATLARLPHQVLEPRITAHGGRLFKTMGDGFLAEFPSAVEASPGGRIWT
jgi:adenylate cyclase